MTNSSKDQGVIEALLERFQKHRLPRALDLKDRVDAGERLSEYDMAFLEEVFADAKQVEPLVDRHPEYQELAARAIRLYKEITDRALQNEKES